MKTKRTLFFRIGSILILIAIAAVMMVIGRGHTVYLDSKALEYEGKTYEPPYRVNVYIHGERAAKLSKDERGMTPWIGQNFAMELGIVQAKGDEEVRTAHALKLPYGMDGVVINLPAYLAGLPEAAYLSQFIPAVVQEPTEEEPTPDVFGIEIGGE